MPMYYPICYLMPNYGPCLQQHQQKQHLPQVHLQVHARPTASNVDTYNSVELTEASSASKYKVMLRSIYSSNSAASSRSAALAAMSSTYAKISAASSEEQGEDSDEIIGDEEQEEYLDVSSLAFYSTLSAVFAAAMIVLM